MQTNIFDLMIDSKLSIAYDASNYYSTTVNSAGSVTFNAVGSVPQFNFTDYTTISTSGSSETFRVSNSGVSGMWSFASQMYNSSVATGTNLNIATSFANPEGNSGLNIFAYGTTTGTNIGGYYEALNGGINVGVIGKSITAKNSAINIGVIGVALNTATVPTQIGGYFALDPTNTPTFTSAALMADNGTTTSDIFVGRDNGTSVFRVTDGGNVILSAPVRLRQYTVATLPAGTQGDVAYVTDALSPSYLTTIVGGGIIVTPVFYNGTNWVAS